MNKLGIEIISILIGTFITQAADFMLIPFIAIYLNFQINLNAADIGLLLMILSATRGFLMFFGGTLCDFFGIKKMLFIGSCIRVIGYILFIYANEFSLLAFAAAIVGWGGAIIVPSSKSIISLLAGEMTQKVFAFRALATNLGSAVGPILGGLLFINHFKIIFFINIIADIVFFLLILKVFPNEISKTILKKNSNIIDNFSTIRHDHIIISLMLLYAGIWTVYSQFNLTIPLFAQNIYNMGEKVSWIFTLNGILVVILQIIIIRWFNSVRSDAILLALSMAIIGVAFISLSLIPTYYSLFVFTIFFTIGEVIIFPTIDNLTSNFAPPHLLGSYFGFISFGWGLGSLIGNSTGGFLYNYFIKIEMISYFWWIFAIISIGLTVLFIGLEYYIKGIKGEVAIIDNNS
jgi:DHA1 family multidrug resistance protein-like MFS transporter